MTVFSRLSQRQQMADESAPPFGFPPPTSQSHFIPMSGSISHPGPIACPFGLELSPRMTVHRLQLPAASWHVDCTPDFRGGEPHSWNVLQTRFAKQKRVRRCRPLLGRGRALSSRPTSAAECTSPVQSEGARRHPAVSQVLIIRPILAR